MEREEMEKRRLDAAVLFAANWNRSMVERYMRVSRTTAHRWHHAYLCGGDGALKSRKPTGRPRFLSLASIADLLRAKFGDGRFTTTSIADDIHHHLGVRYDPDHVCRLLHRIGMVRKDSRWVFEGNRQCR